MQTDTDRRLLDMLAGWSRYARSCAKSEDPNGVTPEQYEAEADAVDDLYQFVGSRNGLTVAEVRELFVRILGVIADGKDPA